MNISLEGFSPEGDIVLTASPSDEELEGPSCVEKSGLWSLVPYENELTLLPRGYQVQQYSKTEENPPKK